MSAFRLLQAIVFWWFAICVAVLIVLGAATTVFEVVERVRARRQRKVRAANRSALRSVQPTDWVERELQQMIVDTACRPRRY